MSDDQFINIVGLDEGVGARNPAFEIRDDTAPGRPPFRAVPDHPEQPPTQGRPVPAAARGGATIRISLPPGLELTAELTSAIRGAVIDYVEANKDAILKQMLENLKVEK